MSQTRQYGTFASIIKWTEISSRFTTQYVPDHGAPEYVQVVAVNRLHDPIFLVEDRTGGQFIAARDQLGMDNNCTHRRQCLAEAIISAVQNFRDEEGITDLQFRLLAQGNQFMYAADDYLGTSLQTCICFDVP